MIWLPTSRFSDVLQTPNPNVVQSDFFFFFFKKDSVEQHLWTRNLSYSDKRKWIFFFLLKNIFIQKVLASYDPNLHEHNSAQCIINSLNFTLSENQFLFRCQFLENRISETNNVINKVTGKHVSINDKHLDFSIPYPCSLCWLNCKAVISK